MSEDCQKCGTAMYDLDEERLCPGCSNQETETEAMTTNQTIDGVSREFVREGRYIVVKPDYEDDIRTERLRNYIEEMCFHTPDCVVVEADWPEYEPVCRMIEARVIGNPTELDAAKATISQLQGLVAELRALLDAPAETEVVHEVQWNSIHGPEGWKVVDAPTFHRCTGRLWDRRLTRKPAAQPQGEPVAWLDQASGAIVTQKLKSLLCESGFEIPLYAERPAPVAAAHTMRSIMEAVDRSSEYTVLTSNQCAALAAALNGTRPVHANPPPGTEPSGTHPHNDGLDEWRKPQDDQARRAELLESLAQQIYDSWQSQPGWVPWQDGMYGSKQNEARQIASRTFELALANQVDDGK